MSSLIAGHIILIDEYKIRMETTAAPKRSKKDQDGKTRAPATAIKTGTELIASAR